MRNEDVAKDLAGSFCDAGWQLERIASLPPAFVRQSIVTPFFQARVVRRSAFGFLVDGYIGSVHRAFESRWIVSNPESRKVNSHCLALNIANIDSLRARQYITGDASSVQISALCSSIINELERLPSDEASLKSVLEHGKIIGRPIESFIVHARLTKLMALRSFLFDRPSV